MAITNTNNEPTVYHKQTFSDPFRVKRKRVYLSMCNYLNKFILWQTWRVELLSDFLSNEARLILAAGQLLIALLETGGAQQAYFPFTFICHIFISLLTVSSMVYKSSYDII